MNTFLKVVSVVLFSQAVFAQTKCIDVSQSSSTGTICSTSLGFIFTRVEKGWRDEASKIVWYDIKPLNSATQLGAQSFCKAHDLSLPSGYSQDSNGTYCFPKSDSDFVTAEKHGIREVLKEIKGTNLWSSSSMEPVRNESAYYFFADEGRLFYAGTHHQLSARCISNPFPPVVAPECEPEKSSKVSGLMSNKDGRILFTSDQKYAREVCAKQGWRLPNAREIAHLSMARGSKGILEKEYVTETLGGKVPSGYYPIKAIEPGGKVDEFYFSHEGYRRPVNEIERGCLWTSSGNPDFPPPNYDYKVIFYAPQGGIDDRALYNSSWFVSCAIRCVRSNL